MGDAAGGKIPAKWDESGKGRDRQAVAPIDNRRRGARNNPSAARRHIRTASIAPPGGPVALVAGDPGPRRRRYSSRRDLFWSRR